MFTLSIPKWVYQKDIHTERTDPEHEYDWYEEPAHERKRRRAIFLNTRRRQRKRHVVSDVKK